MKRRGVVAALIVCILVPVSLIWVSREVPVAGILAWGCVGLSVLLFALYGWDKRAARQGRQRLSESRLHWLAFLGGWPGGLLGQQVFRHKTRKRSFVFVFSLMIALNLAVLVGLIWAFGFMSVHRTSDFSGLLGLFQ